MKNQTVKLLKNTFKMQKNYFDCFFLKKNK